MKKNFFCEGFNQEHFFIGAVVLIVLFLLIVFGKFIFMGIALMLGLVLAASFIGFLGKLFITIKPKTKKETENVSSRTDGGEKESEASDGPASQTDRS